MKFDNIYLFSFRPVSFGHDQLACEPRLPLNFALCKLPLNNLSLYNRENMDKDPYSTNSLPLYCRSGFLEKILFFDKIKQRNTNLLAGDFAWFDHKFFPRLRRPSFNSFARDTRTISSC